MVPFHELASFAVLMHPQISNGFGFGFEINYRDEFSGKTGRDEDYVSRA